jgi:hypothetical protein
MRSLHILGIMEVIKGLLISGRGESTVEKMIVQKPAGAQRKLMVEFGGPPTAAEIEVMRVREERARRNSQWLQTHWNQLLPRALGKFVAVAGEEAFIADTAQEAWAWAREEHPEDDTATVQFVNPERKNDLTRICRRVLTVGQGSSSSCKASRD